MVVVNAAVLGLPESGKTTFFAALHEVLRRTDSLSPIRMHSDYATSDRLAELHSILADPEQGWPYRNYWDDLVELSFTGRYEDGGSEPHDTFETRFLDYDGAGLTDQADRTVHKSLKRHVRRANSVLCFLDGAYVAALLNDDPAGRAYLDEDMAPIWRLLSARRKRVHFVLTKWDVVEKHGTLAHARDALLSTTRFSEAARETCRPGPGRKPNTVRLIPVSAVGADFASPASDGGMTKIPGAVLSPHNVIVPFISVLFDTLSAEAERADKAWQSRDHRSGASATARWWANVPSQDVARHGVKHAFHRTPQWTAALLSRCGQLASRRGAHELGTRWTKQAGRVRSLAPHNGVALSLLAEAALKFRHSRVETQGEPHVIRDHRDALVQTVRLCQLQLDRFRRKFPASRLADRDT